MFFVLRGLHLQQLSCFVAVGWLACAAGCTAALDDEATCHDENSLLLLQTFMQTHLVHSAPADTVTKVSHSVESSNSSTSPATKVGGHLLSEHRNVEKAMKHVGTRVNYSSVTEAHEDVELDVDILKNAIRQLKMEPLTPEEATHVKSVHLVLPFMVVFLLASLCSTLLASWKYTKMIPDSAVIMAVSIFMSFLFLNTDLVQVDLQTFSTVFSELLSLMLLPIIVFNAGWALDKVAFFKEFEHILIFAIGGTAATILLIGYSSWLSAIYLGLHGVTSLRVNMAFGALISSTDPVATLATYSKLKMAKRAPILSALVSGESLINDAVALVVFGALNTRTLTLTSVGLGYHILVLFFGSVMYGISLACILIFVMRKFRLAGHAKSQIVCTVISAYIVYCSADVIGISGIIANVWAGLTFRRFGAKLLSIEAEFVATEHFELLGSMAEKTVFILCGICSGLGLIADKHLAVTFNWRESWRLQLPVTTFGIFATLLCVVARALVTPVCAAASNSMRGSDRITWKDQVIIWLGGLRGGVALLCALQISESWCAPEDKIYILQWTLTIVVVLLMTKGASTEYALRWLGFVPESKGDEESEEEEPAIGSEEWIRTYDHPEVHRREFGKAQWEMLFPLVVGEAHRSRQHSFMNTLQSNRSISYESFS